MLRHLQIRDFAIIEAVDLELQPGLTVLTGETGAGKSIMVDALQLLAGGRAGAEVIRQGAERADVSAAFELSRSDPELARWLDEQSIPAEEELSVRRVIARDGRSRAWLNGQSVPLQSLREVGNLLIDIHGQHEFQSLTRSAAQRELLDGYGRLESLANEVSSAQRAWSDRLERTRALDSMARERDAKLELSRYQVAELSALGVAAQEVGALLEERTRLANRGRLAAAAQTATQQLYESEDVSAHGALSRAVQALRGIAAIDPKLDSLLAPLEEASIQVREIARELARYRDHLEVDGARQDLVERRLAAIEELARKHRVAPTELADHAARLAAELVQLERAQSDLSTLRDELAAALERFGTVAGQLSQQRAAAGRVLSTDVTTGMQNLGMAGGRFEVDVSPAEDAEPTPHGIDRVEFRVAANPGQPLRPLAKVASGGELSRLSLAVRVSCAWTESRCMVFDEVDAGIGGAVAEIVGRELRKLGERGQVLCVTHLPQVASQGHHHLQVVKQPHALTIRTALVTLDTEERVEELARMLGGIEITARTREHAREMLTVAARKSGAGEPSRTLPKKRAARLRRAT